MKITSTSIIYKSEEALKAEIPTPSKEVLAYLKQLARCYTVQGSDKRDAKNVFILN